MDAAGLGEQRVPGGAAGVKDVVVARLEAVREEALAAIEPDPFDGVRLGRRGIELLTYQARRSSASARSGWSCWPSWRPAACSCCAHSSPRVCFALILVIATWPTFERLQHLLGGGRPLAALLLITLATLVLVLPPAVVASSTDCNPDLDPVRCGWQRHRFRRTRAVPWSDLLAGYYELIREWNAAEKHAVRLGHAE
jgi:hypothetical protein